MINSVRLSFLDYPSYERLISIFWNTDKVLVIDEGRQVFFGDVKEARTYFQNVGFVANPRQTVSSFRSVLYSSPSVLTGCSF
jgi:ABC-type multidrug transport system ATPase subunit